MRIKVKPLSVNQCWAGRRFKTPKYKSYEKEVLLSLKKLSIPDGKLEIIITFGLSSKLADYDNPLTAFQVILCKKYKFDDRRIYRGIIQKVDVKKGEEFIEFYIKKFDY